MDLSREVCVCNGISALEIRDYIRKNNISSLEDLLKQEELPLNDKCESCLEEGYENDGFNIALVYNRTIKDQI